MARVESYCSDWRLEFQQGLGENMSEKGLGDGDGENVNKLDR